MNTVDGYAISSWEQRLRRHGVRARPATPCGCCRTCPATAMVQCDLVWLDGTRRSSQSPRHDPAGASSTRLAERGLRRRWPAPSWSSSSSTTPTRTACDRGYRDLTPANQYNVDYSILGTTRVEPLLRDIRNHMYAAGHGRRGRQGRVQLRPARDRLPVRRRADAPPTTTRVYKTGAKEIAAQHGQVDHVHGQVQRARGQLLPHPPVAARRRRRRWCSGDGDGRVRRSTTASSPACWRRMRDFTLLYAPNINSYKRFAAGSFAPTAIAWGVDNRTCAVRLVGHGAGARMENRVPGGDVNPYLALAAMLAGGLHGIEQRAASSRTELVGNAYDLRPAARCRTPCATARDAFAGSARRPGGVRRRGRRPLHEHGRRRAGRVRRRRHRLGAAPRLRADVSA